MTHYFTSDYHFFHEKILQYDNRPFKSISHMHEVIINNHNSVVTNRDVVYIGGDVCFSKQHFIPLIKRLNGNKHLVLGNHDKLNKEQKSIFGSVSKLAEIVVEDHLITICHYALRTWLRKGEKAWHLYGHSHGKLPPYGKSFDIGIMTNNYFPYSFADVKAKMETLCES